MPVLDETVVSGRKQFAGAWKDGCFLLWSVCSGLLSFVVASSLTNVLFWLVITAGLIAGVFVIGNLARVTVALTIRRRVALLPFQKTALIITGVMAMVITAEAYLDWREQGERHKNISSTHGGEKVATDKRAPEISRLLSPEAAEIIARRRGVLTLPSEWERRYISVPGARRAEIWHGVLHVYDENNFRRTTPFPPKRPGIFRLMVVGDSMTYGYGVDERFLYTTILQNVLGEIYNIEIVVLANNGAESEDILNIVRKFLPQLRPDLVFYGVNHNDFLPSGKGQYISRGFEFPIPVILEQFLTKRSRFARLVKDGYDATLRSAGLRTDFFEDILKDFDGYQQRFSRDVQEMNRFVLTSGLPPVVAMVLDQYPHYEGRGYQITKAAEQYTKQAGMNVIETEEYYRRFNGSVFRVSLWEGHADEEGHAIFASMIIPTLEKLPVLQPYRKPRSGSSSRSEVIVGSPRVGAA